MNARTPEDLPAMTPAGDLIATTADWREFLARNPDLVGLDAFIIDSNGNTLGKRLAIADAEKLFEDGVQFSASALLADCRGLGHNPGGIGATDGDPDGSAVPLRGTLYRVPWARQPTAQVLCSMRHIETRAPLWFDAREVLRAVVAQCRAAGIHPVVACELEFYVVSPQRAPDGRLVLAPIPGTDQVPRRAMNLSVGAIEQAAPFLAAVAEAAQAQDLPLSGTVAEYGVGQYEINLRHGADPVRAADEAVLLRRAVRGVAQSLGADATFMAKPFRDQPGSGLHVHVSIVDADGNNRFGAAGGEALLQHAIAGMQDLLFDSIGLLAPNFNSHRRYLGPFVPTTRHWGHNNRSVAFRVPAQQGKSRRVEHRAAGADASPHLVLAAVLAGVLHGLRHSLVATPPVSGRQNMERDPSFPDGVICALERTATSTLLSQYLDPRFLSVYAQLKRAEYGALIDDVFEREYDFYA